MKIIKALQKHVQTISKYQKADLDKEIDKFISDNQSLNEAELLDKIYSTYGIQIKFLEDASQCKAIINIKEWVVTFGVFFTIGVIIGVLSFIVSVMAK
ncbi:hypothetical protein AAE250_11580 [Bacteroides sp. GD17]|jgi:hypothetical protein|uniref:hypothetical protein n=1 Tax=Bacteroides sp. GD17 TaxID=3139826 RepID=UPI00206DD591|nr:hypothetical protein [uncultured Bacteroides sp.]DAV44360.1 MAG TPA: hypothetical protein [Caudoviricetes sp.]